MTSQRSRVSTLSIAARCADYTPAPDFFAKILKSLETVEFQLIKVETRQSYHEPKTLDFDALRSGDVAAGLKHLATSVAGEKDLHRQLRERGVDYIRCRPVQKPLTQYLALEMLHYVFNEREGQRVLCCDLSKTKSIFEELALHDFMVVDQSVAFIHDYDDSGLIRGGWQTNELEDIRELQGIFCDIKSNCKPFSFFLGN